LPGPAAQGHQIVVDLAESVGASVGILGEAADDALATMGQGRNTNEGEKAE